MAEASKIQETEQQIQERREGPIMERIEQAPVTPSDNRDLVMDNTNQLRKIVVENIGGCCFHICPTSIFRDDFMVRKEVHKCERRKTRKILDHRHGVNNKSTRFQGIFVFTFIKARS
ncbi:hypothetical protein JHK82_040549 [Glycine max]|nr:hypothetical protein JHK82_040549 [Glycine max]